MSFTGEVNTDIGICYEPYHSDHIARVCCSCGNWYHTIMEKNGFPRYLNCVVCWMKNRREFDNCPSDTHHIDWSTGKCLMKSP